MVHALNQGTLNVFEVKAVIMITYLRFYNGEVRFQGNELNEVFNRKRYN